MTRKNFTLIVLFIFYCSQALAQGLANKMYVKIPEENLRIAPGGKKIGTLLQGTEMIVLVEQEQWVKIQVTGWIWKGSLTSQIPSSGAGDYHALHILVKTKAEAEDIFKQLQSGKDFQELARTKSVSPSAAKGGDLGYFNKGDFDKQIEQIIDSLKIDQVSAIIETGYGFNIFKRIK